MAVRIVTDSGIDLPGGSDPRLTVVPLGITFGSTTYADGVDLTNDRFYELLIESDELPKTISGKIRRVELRENKQ